MPKKSKEGKKGRSRGKGKAKSKKGKKGKKKEERDSSFKVPETPEPDTFFWVRRKNTSLFVEGTEDLTVKELKLMVGTIYGYFPEDIALFANGEEMLEKKEKKKPEEEKEKDKGQGGRANSKASVKSGSRGSKDKKGKGSKEKDKRRKSGDPKDSEEAVVQIFTIGNYGYNARSSSLFKPGEVGLVFRDKDGNFETLDMTPYTKAAEIPESVKPYLRNYNVEPVAEGAVNPDEEPSSMRTVANKAKSKLLKK